MKRTPLLAVVAAAGLVRAGEPPTMSEREARPADPIVAPSEAAGLPLPRIEPELRKAETAVEREIEHLLDFVRGSHVVFVRNGGEHTPAEAADHMAKKREHFKNRIVTAEDFIRLAASRSLLSGEPYSLRTPDGKTEKMADWLTEELGRFRSRDVPGESPSPPGDRGAAARMETVH